MATTKKEFSSDEVIEAIAVKVAGSVKMDPDVLAKHLETIFSKKIDDAVDKLSKKIPSKRSIGNALNDAISSHIKSALGSVEPSVIKVRKDKGDQQKQDVGDTGSESKGLFDILKGETKAIFKSFSERLSPKPKQSELGSSAIGSNTEVFSSLKEITATLKNIERGIFVSVKESEASPVEAPVEKAPIEASPVTSKPLEASSVVPNSAILNKTPIENKSNKDSKEPNTSVISSSKAVAYTAKPTDSFVESGSIETKVVLTSLDNIHATLKNIERGIFVFSKGSSVKMEASEKTDNKSLLSIFNSASDALKRFAKSPVVTKTQDIGKEIILLHQKAASGIGSAIKSATEKLTQKTPADDGSSLTTKPKSDSLIASLLGSIKKIIPTSLTQKGKSTQDENNVSSSSAISKVSSPLLKLRENTITFIDSITNSLNKIATSPETKKALETGKSVLQRAGTKVSSIKQGLIEKSALAKPAAMEAAAKTKEFAAESFTKLKDNTNSLVESLVKSITKIATSPETTKALETGKKSLEQVGTKVNSIKQGIIQRTEAFKPTATAAVSKTKEFAVDSFTKLKENTTSLFNTIAAPLKKASESSQAKDVKNAGSQLLDGVKGFFSSLKQIKVPADSSQKADGKVAAKKEYSDHPEAIRSRKRRAAANNEVLDGQAVYEENSKIKEKKKKKGSDTRENDTNVKEESARNSAVVSETKSQNRTEQTSPPLAVSSLLDEDPTANRSLLEQEEKPQIMLFGGFTENGVKNLKEKLPEIVGDMFKAPTEKKKKDKDKEKPKDDGSSSLLDMLKGTGLFASLGILIAGGALVLGGLAALVKGLSTDGPFKGILKILAQGGLIGGIKLLAVGATRWMASLSALVQSPFALMRMLGGALGKVTGMFTAFGSKLMGMFSSGIGAVARMLPTTGIFGSITKVIGGFFAKFVGKGLNFIPIIGPAISLGFAVSRLLKGDVIGGLIDVASALVSFIPGVGPILGTTLSLGLSVLNAVLDWKGGGSKPGATANKGGILMGWLKGLGNLILKGAMALPIIGPGIRAVKAMIANDYGEGLKQLAYMIPGVELIGALFGDKNVSAVSGGAASMIKGTAGFLGKAIAWVAKMIYGGIKQLPIIGPALKAVEAFSSGNFLRGLKQLAYIMPGVELIGGFFGDKDVGVVGKVGGVAGGLTKWVGGFAAWVFKKIYAGVKQLPIIGPALKAVEAFASGNFLKGLKQLAYIIPPFEMIGALFGDKETGGVAKVAAAPIGWIGSLAKWALKKIISGLKLLPIIGPAVSALGEFVKGNFLKGLKQMAYIFPPFEMLGGLLGDKEAGSVAGKVGGGVGTVAGWIGSLAKWALKKIISGLKLLPIIGPAISALGEFAQGNFLKGLKQLAYMVPGMEMLGGLLGDKEAGSVVGKAGNTIGNWIKGLKDWVFEKITNMPVIGPLIKGIKWLATDPLKALKTLALAVPILGGILSFFGIKEEKEGDAAAPPAPKSPFAAIKDMILEKARAWWKGTWSWVRWLAAKVLPEGIVKALDEGSLAKEDIKTEGESAEGGSEQVKPAAETAEPPADSKETVDAKAATTSPVVSSTPQEQQAAPTTTASSEAVVTPQEQQAAPTTPTKSEAKNSPIISQAKKAAERPKDYIDQKIEAVKEQSADDEAYKVDNIFDPKSYIGAAEQIGEKTRKTINGIYKMLGSKAADLAMFAAVGNKLKSKPSEEAAEQEALLKPQKDKTSEGTSGTLKGGEVESGSTSESSPNPAVKGNQKDVSVSSSSFSEYDNDDSPEVRKKRNDASVAYRETRDSDPEYIKDKERRGAFKAQQRYNKNNPFQDPTDDGKKVELTEADAKDAKSIKASETVVTESTINGKGTHSTTTSSTNAAPSSDKSRPAVTASPKQEASPGDIAAEKFGLTKTDDGTYISEDGWKYTYKDGVFSDEFGEDATDELRIERKSNKVKSAGGTSAEFSGGEVVPGTVSGKPSKEGAEKPAMDSKASSDKSRPAVTAIPKKGSTPEQQPADLSSLLAAKEKNDPLKTKNYDKITAELVNQGITSPAEYEQAVRDGRISKEFDTAFKKQYTRKSLGEASSEQIFAERLAVNLKEAQVKKAAGVSPDQQNYEVSGSVEGNKKASVNSVETTKASSDNSRPAVTAVPREQGQVHLGAHDYIQRDLESQFASPVDLTTTAPEELTAEATPDETTSSSSSQSTTIDSAVALGGGKSDQLLTKIAANFDTSNQNLSLLVRGFNKLAGALGQLGVSIAEKPGGNTIVNSNSGGGGGQAPARTSEIAKGGNQEIANFRASIEKMKQRPA